MGNSLTGLIISLINVFKLGSVIGEELVSNQFCSAGFSNRPQSIVHLKSCNDRNNTFLFFFT